MIDGDFSQEEVRLLQLLRDGLADLQIASELNVSMSTLRRRISILSEKLRAQSRVSLVVRAIEEGIIAVRSRSQSSEKGEGPATAEEATDGESGGHATRDGLGGSGPTT